VYAESVALTQSELDTYEYKLRKRGFRRDDVFLHDCPDCKAKSAVLTYIIAGKVGGRDIRLCGECGSAHSSRQSGLADRVEDVGFDLKTFLA